MEQARSDAPASRTNGIIAWIRHHDERALFVLAYITLAVTLTIFISLFWLVAVVAVHAAFEVIRQSHRFGAPAQYLAETLWEIKLDIALVIFALALALYMDLIMGILGLQSAARAGAAAKAGGRFLAWERVIRAVALTVDDFVHVGRFIKPIVRIFKRNGGRPAQSSPAHEAEESGPPMGDTEDERPATTSWVQPYGWGDKLSLALGVACLLLIVASPLFTHHTPVTVVTTMAAEMHPFPFE